MDGGETFKAVCIPRPYSREQEVWKGTRAKAGELFLIIVVFWWMRRQWLNKNLEGGRTCPFLGLLALHL